MGYYDEFPRTNFYQQDLGWLIEKYFELKKDYGTLVKIYDIIKKDIKDITLKQLKEWLDAGTLESIINEQIFGELNDKVNTLQIDVAYLMKRIIHMKDYVIPDGNTDNTEKMQQAINEAQGHILYVDGASKPYRCNQLTLKSNSIYYCEPSVTIKANDTWISADRWQDPLIDVRLVDNVKWYGNGALITMNKPVTILTEHAHCMGTRGATNVYIENMRLMNANGDGFYIDQYDGDTTNKPSSNITVNNLYCDSNARQGLSVVSGFNLVIENCTFTNTGGKAPQSGLDIEAELRSPNMSNIIVRNCSFINNSYAGLLVACGVTSLTTLIDVVVENCYFTGASYGIFVNGVKSGQHGAIKVNNCFMEKTSRCAIFDAYNKNDAIIRTYSNCTSLDANNSNTLQNGDTVGELGWATAFLIHAQDNETNGNCNFIGCQAISTNGYCKSAFGFTQAGDGIIDGLNILSCSQKGIAQSFNGSSPHLRNTVVTGLSKPINSQASRVVDSSNYYQSFINGTLTLGTNLNQYSTIEFINTGGGTTTLAKQSGINVFPYNKTTLSLNSIGSNISLNTTNGADYFIMNELGTSLFDA